MWEIAACVVLILILVLLLIPREHYSAKIGAAIGWWKPPRRAIKTAAEKAAEAARLERQRQYKQDQANKISCQAALRNQGLTYDQSISMCN